MDKLEVYYAVMLASWLNMAGVEPSILGRQYLDRDVPSTEPLRQEVVVWEQGGTPSPTPCPGT